MSLLVKIGKKGKKLLKNFIAPSQPIEVRYTRRIERICTDRRICAMTFDDGPMDLPASPDRFGGKSLTDILLDTLEEFGACISDAQAYLKQNPCRIKVWKVKTKSKRTYTKVKCLDDEPAPEPDVL